MTAITRHPLRTLTIGLAALAAGLLLLAVAAAWFWPIDDLGERLARQASERLGAPVVVDGDVSLRLWPSPTIRATGVTIGPRAETGDEPLGTLDAISLSLDWLPLLGGRAVPNTLRLEAPVLQLREGVLARPVAGAGSDDERRDDRPASPDLQVRGGEVHWNSVEGDRKVSVTGLDLELAGLAWGAAEDAGHPFARVSLDLAASADALRIDALELSEIDLEGSASDGVFTSDRWRMTALDSRGDGRARLDFRGSAPLAALDFRFGALRLSALPGEWIPAGRLSGSADLSASLESRVNGPAGWLRRLQGEVTLDGRDLRLRGVDLDEELARYRRTQRFSLVDAGAVVLLGPAALFATKGSDFVRLLDETEDAETRIVHLLSDWSIEEGIARTRDAALSTRRNRVAVRASLDLPSRRIDDATVAVVDQRGCALVTQEVSGSLDAPVVEEPHPVESLLGAPLDLLQRGLDAISRDEEDCEAFYTGAVAAPSD